MRDILESKYRKNRNEHNRQKATAAGNLVTNMKLDLKRNYYSNAIRNAHGDS